jgi:hypothetical protein
MSCGVATGDSSVKLTRKMHYEGSEKATSMGKMLFGMFQSMAGRLVCIIENFALISIAYFNRAIKRLMDHLVLEEGQLVLSCQVQ